MAEMQKNDSSTIAQDLFPLTLKSKAKYTLTFTFLVILALGLLGFVMLRVSIAEAMGETVIGLDIFSVTIIVIGSGTLTYLYYTRYAKKELILTENTCTLIVGNRTYEYSWKDFSLASLSVSYSASGIRGFLIRLYESDLEGEYVDLPFYRFPKIVDIFDLRSKIDALVRPNTIINEK